MKIAIISDVHSNLEALQACIARAQTAGVEQYVCLGDAIGYGPDPAASLERLMALPNFVMIRGNHEEALLTSQYKGLREHIRRTLDWTREQLSAQQLAYLRQLPYREIMHHATMVHASAHNNEHWPYVYGIELARACIRASETPITFIGHTHRPQLYYEMPNRATKYHEPTPETAIPLYQQGRYVINVGSVGQPRDDNTAASFVIFDVQERLVVFYRVAYDYMTTANKIIARGLPEQFAERLKTGQ